MKVGDLVNNTHALDRSGLGLIVEVKHWLNPPPGCPDYSWNSAAWLEIINEQE